MTRRLPLLTPTRRTNRADRGFGALETERGRLPLHAMDVSAQIDGLIALVSVKQTFVNTHDEPLEATYIFPLPDRAAVTRFRLEVAGRIVEGQLRERGEARRIYDRAIEDGHRAAITEEERPDVFTMRVGNLPPGEEATVHLTLAGPLPCRDGEATFQFPLVVAPRFIPGSPLPGEPVGDGHEPDTDAVPDASRISPPVLLPGFPNPVRLSLSVDLACAGLPISDVRSSLHAVVTEAEGGVQRVQVLPGERLNRDFILRFRLGGERLSTSLCLRPDQDSDRGVSREGTFVLSLVPPHDAGGARRPRDVAFVLDRSGSMSGWKMVAARRALARMIDTLGDLDRFNVYVFDSTTEVPPGFPKDGLIEATDRNRFRAVEYLAKVDARGGTVMTEPLRRAADALVSENADRDRVLVLVTDGQVGNEDQMLRDLGPRLDGVRVFTLGIDRAVNAGFLKRLAALGRGACELVESENRLDEVMQHIHRLIDTPLLRDVRVECDGATLDAVVPGRLPDLFEGVPLVLLGRYRGEPKGMTVRAKDRDGRAWSMTVKPSDVLSSAVTAVWARGRVRELEDRWVTTPRSQKSLGKELTETSLRFGVLCRFTAFVAVDVAEVVNPGGEVRRVVQPVELPSGWDARALGLPAGRKREALRGRPSRMRSQPPSPRKKKRALPEMPPGPGESVAKGGPPKAQPLATFSPTEDLRSFRSRAAELQKSLADDVPDRLAILRSLLKELPAIVKDMKRACPDGQPWLDLEMLLHTLKRLASQKRPRRDAIDAAWKQAKETLRLFSEPATPSIV